MKIMICESEEVLLMAIEFRLRKQGYEVEICKKDDDLARSVYSYQPNVVLIDLDAGKGKGLDLVKTVKETRPNSGVLLLADPDEEEKIFEGFGMGIEDFISKPFKPAELLLRVQRIVADKE